MGREISAATDLGITTKPGWIRQTFKQTAPAKVELD